MRVLESLCCLLFSLCVAAAAPAETPEQLAQQVRDAETAFAATMERRDHAAFASYIAEDAVFFDKAAALRGREAIAAGWKPLYEGPHAPFSWHPESVEVLASGTLAHSSGPILDPQGQRVGTFNSVWRRGADGRWQVVFDKGCDACACARITKH
ncbi:nuclear transport factor 2 family protein [Povalibacter sp.]|uniref:YybH family protein n=1 Tax=Povalibacter sp. TaxID=1962978 RepID=UPI002F40F63D